MIVGMDFGTTNSGMAVYDGGQVQVLGIDPSNTNAKVARTALYVTNDQQIFIGRAAVDRYFEHNLGRPVRMERVWIGEIELTHGEMSWVQDVYIWVDALSPGRLFLSVKTSLSDADYVGTVIEPFFYSLEDLVALYLSVTKTRAETLLDCELKQVVLGRPVKFNADPKKDALAQQRLIDAALRAGYETVYFQYEPIAAALHYEQSLPCEQNVLIFDFGGGTLDLTVMRLGNANNRQVLATGGVPIAGDVFDRRIIRSRLPKHFGEDTLYGSPDKPLTMPGWVHNTFSNWQTILQLQTPENVRLMQTIAHTARNPKGINALISLVSGNYGLRMFDAVERSKRRLSRRNATIIPFSGPAFNVREPITRAEFEAIINREFRAIEQTVTETLAQSGLKPGQIDAVIRTGGSSQVPLFEDMLKERFGPDKVQASNIFSSVTSGLGITGHHIESGLLDSRAYRRPDGQFMQRRDTRPNVSPVNLDALITQITLNQEEAGDAHDTSASWLVILPEAGEPTLTPLPDLAAEVTLSTPPAAEPSLRLLATASEDVLLWVTSEYRFFLMPPRQMETLQANDLTVAGVQMLEENETLCSLDDWQTIRQAPLLLLITSQGIGRHFRMETMQSRIESPTPFKLDRRLMGRPVSVLGIKPGDEVVVITEGGRAARVDVRGISVQGSQVVNRPKADRVIQALTVRPEERLLLLTPSGHARRITVSDLPQPDSKTRAISVMARRPVCGVALEGADAGIWAVTSKRLILLDPQSIPLEDASSKKTHPICKLTKGETICGLFSVSV